MQKLTTAFEASPTQAHGAGAPDFIVRSGPLFAEFSATETRLSLPAADHDLAALSIQLQNANPNAAGTASEQLPGQSNYLLGTDPAAWRTHVAQFGRITYREVYPGIDLTYYGAASQLEHDFIVHQGTSPASIRMKIGGTQQLSLAANGELQIHLKDRVVVLRKPIAYQSKDGIRNEIPVDFALSGDAVTFNVGEYDHSLALVIDPVLDYSTFLGDASIYVTAVAVDAAGSTYITGEAPVAYPASTTTEACIKCLAGTNRLAVFVTKLNPAGNGVLYSTFLGGSTDPYGGPSNNQSSMIAVVASGSAVVSGYTSSVDFPVKNPIPAGVPSFADGFLTSLSPDGSSLIFSSRIGGSSSGSSSANTYPGALTVDPAGNVYLAGATESPYLPVTSGALHNATPAYATNTAFLMKLTPAGALTFSGIAGALGRASGGVGPTGLAVDETGTIYMAGTAGSTDFSTPAATPWPITSGAYQANLISPSQNAPFVTRISANGSSILSSTLVGAGSAVGLTLTQSHDVILAGAANYNFPVTADAYNKNVSISAGGVTTLGASAYFAKVSADGTTLLYSSAFGSSGYALYIRAISQDSTGNLWLAGTSNGPLTDLLHPLQSVYSSTTGFVSRFDPTLHTLLFETYLNSATGSSQIYGLALDRLDHAHVAGSASQEFPTTPSAYLRSVTPPPPNYNYTYGFAASINASSPGPGICFANQSSPYTVVGTTDSASFDIVSCGDGPLTISSLQLTSDVFSLTSHACEKAIPAGQSCTVTYSFTPKVMGAAAAKIAITSDAPLGPGLRPISATGTAPVAYLPVSSSYAFQPQVIGATPQTGTLILGNRGTAPLTVYTSRTTISGPFTLGTTTCAAPLNPGSSCTYRFTFTPTAAGAATGSIVLYTNDPVTPSLTFTLTGTALADYPQPVISSLAIPTVSLDSGVTTISINGTGFFPASTVLVNGYSAPITLSSNTSITVSIDPTTLGGLGDYPVQVVNPGAGGPGNIVRLTAYHLIPLISTGMVSNPVTKLLYAAIPSTSKTNPNTILPIDPTTGAFGTPIPVLNNPVRLALSDDGHYLYVGFYYLYGASPPAASLQRIDLKTGAVDRTFTLPGSSNGILDMHVVPGTPTSLLVSLTRAASPSENGIALFGDSGLLQYLANDYPKYIALDRFTFTSDPSAYYGYPVSGVFFGNGTLTATTVTPITSGGTCCEQATGSIVASDGTLLYTNSGQVWDPKTKTLLGRYDASLFYEPDVLPDPTAKRTFILRSSYTAPDGGQYPAIASYDPSTFTLAGVLYFPPTGTPASLARWGTNGFSFLTGFSGSGDFTTPPAFAKVLLVRSRLATPGATAATSILSLSPAVAAVGSPALTLTVTGSGFTPASTVLLNGTIRTTTFVSATQLTAAVTAADLASVGTASVTVATDSSLTSALSFTIARPSLTVSPSMLTFSTQTVGLAAAARTVTIQNSGPINVSGIALSFTGTDTTSFASTSTCATTLAPGATCTVSVTFTPATTGLKQASLQIASSSATQSVTLTGTGASPALTVSTLSVAFGQVTTGTSVSSAITLQNSGSVPLANLIIGVNGANAADFTQTNTCSTAPAPAASCTITITFTPSATGTRSAALNVQADSVALQSVALTGTAIAPDFALPAPATPTATVTAGQPATFNFKLSQTGSFPGTVTMTCGTLPAYASCTFSPATVSFSSSSTATVALTITTQQTVIAAAEAPSFSRSPSSLVALAGLILLPLVNRRTRRKLTRHSPLLALLLALSLLTALTGCGGSSSGSTSTPPVATVHNTPAGTYNVTISATSGAVTHSTAVTLAVQ